MIEILTIIFSVIFAIFCLGFVLLFPCISICRKIGFTAVVIGLILSILSIFLLPDIIGIWLLAIGIFLLILGILLSCKCRFLTAKNVMGLILVAVSIILAVLSIIQINTPNTVRAWGWNQFG
ncbi:hypothetical protein [Hydrogenoanaerobacterium saccharovorans]|uniref:hypothetical protein n=1 Tax=Hydrogenoanaerobacterium saccharovorans TaxID=474960 RepID=UPI000B8A0F52|nr:hypothetical protein [Hydrogenoanaerobacterium saccharovorans]